jgi:hypothetical protein
MRHSLTCARAVLSQNPLTCDALVRPARDDLNGLDQMIQIRDRRLGDGDHTQLHRGAHHDSSWYHLHVQRLAHDRHPQLFFVPCRLHLPRYVHLHVQPEADADHVPLACACSAPAFISIYGCAGSFFVAPPLTPFHAP